MTFVGSRHFCFQGVLLQKIFKVLFYYSVGIKMNIIQARLYSFFLLIEIKIFSWASKYLMTPKYQAVLA